MPPKHTLQTDILFRCQLSFCKGYFMWVYSGRGDDQLSAELVHKENESSVHLQSPQLRHGVSLVFVNTPASESTRYHVHQKHGLQNMVITSNN